jgi:hypothetical protein
VHVAKSTFKAKYINIYCSSPLDFTCFHISSSPCPPPYQHHDLESMAHIILTGATGTAGAAILDVALKSSAIARISVLSRRPVALADGQPKANVIIHKDWTAYPPALLDQLKGATGCIWAQGISSRGMNERDYEEITVTYPVAAAIAFSELSGNGEQFKFVYMSGEGADMTEKSSLLFGRIKGRAETALLKLEGEVEGLSVFNVRPATINPEGNYLQERQPTLQDRASTVLGGFFERVWKSFVIPTPKLAKVCLDLATGDGKPLVDGVGIEAEGRLVRNTGLRRLAGM